MILSLFLLFLMIFIITAAIFYLFCFFLPALRLKYEGISASLATELHFDEEKQDSNLQSDFSKVAVIEKTSETPPEKRLVYKGEKNCRLFHQIYRSEYKDPTVCIGFGDCVAVCPQEAITIKHNVATVSKMCNGCGKCISSCPENIISLVPSQKKSQENEGKGFKFCLNCYRLFTVGFRG
mgnify:CR=1 FL=1